MRLELLGPGGGRDTFKQQGDPTPLKLYVDDTGHVYALSEERLGELDPRWREDTG